MARKDKRNRGKPEFVNRGRRITKGAGLYYHSKCVRYALYKSDQVCGIDMKPVRWIAFSVTNGVYRVISRHLSRKYAERACEKFDKSHSK